MTSSLCLFVFSLVYLLLLIIKKIFSFICKYSCTNRHSLHKLRTWVKHYNVDVTLSVNKTQLQRQLPTSLIIFYYFIYYIQLCTKIPTKTSHKYIDLFFWYVFFRYGIHSLTFVFLSLPDKGHFPHAWPVFPLRSRIIAILKRCYAVQISSFCCPTSWYFEQVMGQQHIVPENWKCNALRAIATSLQPEN